MNDFLAGSLVFQLVQMLRIAPIGKLHYRLCGVVEARLLYKDENRRRSQVRTLPQSDIVEDKKMFFFSAIHI